MGEKGSKKTWAAAVVIIAAVAASLAFFAVSEQLPDGGWPRALLIALGIIVIIAGGAASAWMEWRGAAFECRRCGELFSPGFWDFLFAMQLGKAKKLRCSACGGKGWCRSAAGRTEK